MISISNISHKKVTWLELFYDLIYVAAVSVTAHVLAHSHHGAIPADVILKYILIFVPLWWAWTGFTVYVNRFGKDDTAQRIAYFVQMAFVIVMAASINLDFDAYYLAFMLGYVGIRLSTVFMYVRTWIQQRGEPRRIARYLGLAFLGGALISFASVLVPGEAKFFVLYFGIFLDILLPLLARKKVLSHLPVHHPHLLERYGLATIILLGELILVIVNGLREGHAGFDTILTAVLGFGIAVSLWWHYFESSEHIAAEDRKSSGQSVIYGHLLTFMSLGLIANVVHYGFHHELTTRSFAWLSLAGFAMYAASAAIIFLPGKSPAHIRRSLIRTIAFAAAAAVILLLLPSTSAVYAASFAIFAAYALAEGVARSRSKRAHA
ncbi:low temperature requirement protein A [Saccharibacillus alkalitolerans]|uniref:Low temperature requirement protein A n=1 Tax=Saccharibacillus alkalitolerans TaxID=2705290 RepID=A0ABX0F6Q9_9BACL|nr:low temperature requirement protein A [Saccharibacillus alkalitolerans]NGZ76457.1 low temperature requirement protein A [Saccharibacillus alkalitolerans]